MLANPIFAFGSGRSGTTLLAKLLDSSTRVLYRHEPDKVQPLNSLPYLPEPAEYAQHLDSSRRYVEALAEQRAPFCNTKAPIFDKAFRSAFKTRILRTLAPAYMGLEKAHLPVKVPDLLSGNDFRVLIKSVNSTGRVPMFAQAIPDMKFIHIVRHPGAVLASLLNGIENNKMRRFDFVDSVAKMSIAANYPFSIEYLSNASFEEKSVYVWMLQNDKVYMEMKDGANYHLVSYEDLCVNMADRVQEMCDFLGLEFDQQMRDFIRMISGVNQESGYFSVIKNPTSSIAKWEDRLDAEVTEKITAIARSSEVGRYSLDRYQAAVERMRRAD